MVKKKAAGKTESKASAKAAKKAKAEQKTQKKQNKSAAKSKAGGAGADDDDEDLESILERMRKEWEEAHTVTEELVEGPPSRRASATLTPCPNGNHLWFIGGEFFSPDNKAHFYNDVFRYSPEKNEWRKYVCKVCPGPRSAHAVVPYPGGGGKLFLFGGEFSSLNQNTFHHYRDFWCLDIATYTWDRIETKIRPSARSGHRMAVWKHYIVLFGGFYDPGITTRYLQDLWVFDIQEYKWSLIEFQPSDNRPSPRSGFSFLPTPDGIILHGGYCKEYVKGKRPVGVVLEDTWFLHMSLQTPDPSASSSKKSRAEQLVVKWERRKRNAKAYAPSPRSGCTMALWSVRDMGILFGGVADEDTDEETLTSVFYNDMYAYQWADKGRWISLTLKKPKKKPGQKTKQVKQATLEAAALHKASSDDEGHEPEKAVTAIIAPSAQETDPDDPTLTLPLTRYNAMLAVLRNSLYIYGGIYESGSREYTLDDFYTIQLDKMDRFTCLKASEIDIKEGVESDEDDDDDDDDEDTDEEEDYGSEDGTVVDDENALEEYRPKQKLDVIEDEAEEIPEEEEEVDDIRKQATVFMGVAKSNTRSEEEAISTPLPGETLAAFYARSRQYWAQQAVSNTDNRGKQLRRNGFELAQERYKSYKPILQEIEKILAEAGLDEEEIKRGVATAAPGPPGTNESRNRR